MRQKQPSIHESDRIGLDWIGMDWHAAHDFKNKFLFNLKDHLMFVILMLFIERFGETQWQPFRIGVYSFDLSTYLDSSMCFVSAVCAARILSTHQHVNAIVLTDFNRNIRTFYAE